MPSNYPRAPLPLLAILLAPFTWQYGRPDLFDSYRSEPLSPACLARSSHPQLSLLLDWSLPCSGRHGLLSDAGLPLAPAEVSWLLRARSGGCMAVLENLKGSPSAFSQAGTHPTVVLSQRGCADDSDGGAGAALRPGGTQLQRRARRLRPRPQQLEVLL